MNSNEKDFNFIYFAWLLSLLSVAGSLYYSNVLLLPPCSLCWYQRICIFPMVFILASGFLLKDKNVIWYAGPLSFIGWIISLYHNLLYYKIIPKPLVACSSGSSCTEKQIEYLGFISIPLMAFTSLTLTLLLLIKFYYSKRKS